LALVGNDIVDRRDPANNGKSLDGRFLEKVFLPEERNFIRLSADPDGALWALWAVKEAAWKASVKAAPADGRGWKGIRVRLRRRMSRDGAPAFPAAAGEDGGENPAWRRLLTGDVDTWAGTLAFRVDQCDDGTHALCRLGPADPAERITWKAINRSDLFLRCKNKSDLFYTGARGDLIRHLNASLGLEAGDAVIGRKPGPRGLLPPRLYVRGVPSSLDISLSHDGRYAAWALRTAR
jgi:phosphopantetheinyl transferase (holo-ACP synthase)